MQGQLDRRIIVSIVSIAALLLLFIRRRRATAKKQIAASGRSPTTPAASPTGVSPTTTGSPGFDDIKGAIAKKKKIRVDGVFVARLRKLMAICVPSFFAKEGVTLAALTVLLVLRTKLTVIIAEVVGGNAKALINRDPKGFVSGVIDLGLWALPSSVVNSGIRYTTALMEQQFRGNLQRYMHKQYLTQNTVYKVCAHHRQQEGEGEKGQGSAAVDSAALECAGTKQVLPPTEASVQIDNPDHRLTEDILAFAHEATDIFPTVFKPLVDIFTFIYELSKNGGVLPPTLMLAYYFVSGNLLRSIMPNFAKLTAQSQQKEGDLRSIHTQLSQHAEEVAFYRGELIERENANKSLESLVKHQLHFHTMKAYTDFMDAILIKYGATCIGYAVCSIGVFQSKGKVPTAELTRIYIRSSQLYLPLARAFGKIVMLHKKITALAGYTSRVAELYEVFAHIRQLKIQSKGVIREVDRCDSIIFKDVDVVAPSGITLLKGLTLTIRRGQHLLIMGNNGSGKSALMRCIAGLWPIPCGEITRPPLKDIAFLPQRTFLPTGNFRSQLIFPDSEEDMKRKGVTDDELLAMAASLGLSNVIAREGGLDSEKEWNDVYSGGERQRVAFVRILYHRPQFAFLDESSSAVSQEIEPQLYKEVKARGTTLVTVSHRDTLKQFHDLVLNLDGMGGYTLSAIREGPL